MRRATARVTMVLLWLFLLVVLALLVFPGDPEGDPPDLVLLVISAVFVILMALRAVIPRRGRRL